MKKILSIFLIVAVIVVTFSLTVYAEDYFDLTQAKNGAVGIAYKSASKLKVQVVYEPTKTAYVYNLNGEGKKEFVPLQMGNGKYKISLMENTTADKYKLVGSETVELKLDDPKVVYLTSTQNINWSSNPDTVAKATELTKSTDDLSKKVELLWDFVVKNNTYDTKKIATLPTTYLPAPDKTLKEKTGICYDFASLLASMLRSEGIPAKLVKGYAKDYAEGYHAWNEIYDAKNKQWIVVDSTYDLQVYTKKKVDMSKKADGFQKVYEY